MAYTVVIGQFLLQPFQVGDVVPQYTAIIDNFCCTVISCVGKAPAELKFDEPTAQMNYNEWKFFLNSSKGLRRLAAYLEKNKTQIVYLSHPEIKEIFEQIKIDMPKKVKKHFLNRAEWLSFWTDESVRRYGQNAAVGLF